MLENLIAEAIGILVTVFLVDRIIQWREAKKWRPSKNLIKAKLFRIAYGLTTSILGQLFLFKHSSELHFFYFGSVKAVSAGSFRKVGSDEILKELEEKIKSWKEVEIYFNKDSLNKTYQELSNILEISSFLFEPKLHRLILELEHELASTIDLSTYYKTSEQEVPLSELRASLHRTLLWANIICLYLEENADKVRSFSEEFIDDLF